MTDTGTPTLTLGAAQALDDTTALGKITGPYAIAIVDTAANISANLDALGADDITSITISDNALVGASVEQLTSDAATLAKLDNENGTAYQLAITDTVGDVEAGLATLVANTSNIASITATGGTVTVSVATVLADQPTLDKIVGGFAIADLAATVAANLDALNADAQLKSITLTDGGTPTLTLSIAEALNDTAALSKIVSPHNVAIADTAANIAAITSAQASALEAAGYTRISATGPVTLTVAQAWILSGDGLIVTGGPVTVAGPAATMLALTAAQDAAFIAAGYVLEVADTAAHILALTTAQISSLAALHVKQIASTDTSIVLTTAKAIAFGSAHIALSAPVGSAVEVSGTLSAGWFPKRRRRRVR